MKVKVGIEIIPSKEVLIDLLIELYGVDRLSKCEDEVGIFKDHPDGPWFQPYRKEGLREAFDLYQILKKEDTP